jgi:uncharacterized protein (TIGR03067 family)
MRVPVALVVAAGLLVGAYDPTKDDGEMAAGELEGTWAYVSWEWDGWQLPPKELKPLTVTFRGDKVIEKECGRFFPIWAGTHKLDPAKSPKAVDITVTEGEDKGRTWLGIYEQKGDTLRACFDAKGKQRPTEFKTQARSDRYLFVLKRQTPE